MGNLKKLKRIIAYSAVSVAVLSSTILLTNAFSAEGGLRLLTGGMPTKQPVEANDKQAANREANGLLTGGSSDSLDGGDASHIAGNSSNESMPAEKENGNQDERDVRKLVEDFGKVLQKVSLLAPEDVLVQSIKENYGSFVTPELLQKWQAEPQSAPGRMVSSPWPDRIDILDVEVNDKTQYTVKGEIVEVTSTELESGEAAVKRPVTITVRKTGGRWLITGVALGDYLQPGPVVYENNRYGFKFSLPETWKGYTIIEEQWKGLSNGGETPETGPQLLIRHPDWNREAPRQDIPIMVFTHEQWNALQKGKFSVSAAPIGPTKLGSNSVYIFALPARYNYAFPKGFEEVEEILKGNPLVPTEPSEQSPLSEKDKRNEARRNEIEVKFDIQIKSDENTMIIKPSDTMKASPELLEQARKIDEESKKPLTGLFRTELDVQTGVDEVLLSISLHNISQEDIKLDFDLGREYAFSVSNSDGYEVYSSRNGDCYAAAISHHKLKKGEKLSFSCSWDYKDNSGNKVPPGTYTITVKMFPMINYKRNFSQDELTAVENIEVKG